MLNKVAKGFILISTLIAISCLVGWYFKLDMLLYLLISGYLFVLGIAILLAKEGSRLFAIITATTMYMVFFVCFASYGLAFWKFYAAGIALSIGIFVSKRFTPKEKYISYIGMIMIFFSCCYFLPGPVGYLEYAAIILEVGLIAYKILKR